MVGERRLVVPALAMVFAGLIASAAMAQAVPPAADDTLSLSDAEKAELMNHNTESSVDAARAGSDGVAAPRRGIHGEVGALVGSRGTRAAYGVAAIPLGQNAGATVSFESSHTDRPR